MMSPNNKPKSPIDNIAQTIPKYPKILYQRSLYNNRNIPKPGKIKINFWVAKKPGQMLI